MRCTTPEPFSNLEADVRERQFKAEQTRREKDEEERRWAAQQQEREKKVPVGHFPMVEKHQEEQDKRAAARRAARLEEDQKQFSRFQAKPAPRTSENDPTWEERYAAQEMERSKRIQERIEATKLRHKEDPIAARFSQPLQKKVDNDQEVVEPVKKKKPEPEEITKQLDEAHDRWRRALEKAKVGGRAGTKPVDIFAKREAEAKKRAAEREETRRARDELRAAKEQKRRAAEDAKLKRAMARGFNIDTARQTYSSYLKVQAVRDKVKRERDAIEREAQIAKEREDRLKDAGRRLRQEIKHDDIRRDIRMENLLQQAAANQRAFKRNLIENKKKLAHVAKQAPSLMARLELKTLKDKARAKALKQVAKLVYGTTNVDWNNVLPDMDIFDDDEKLFLNISRGLPDDDDDLDLDLLHDP